MIENLAGRASRSESLRILKIKAFCVSMAKPAHYPHLLHFPGVIAEKGRAETISTSSEQLEASQPSRR